MRFILIVLLLLVVAVPCVAQTFVLDATSNCPDLTEATTFVLTTGTYYIEYVSGAWSPISDDAIWNGYAWASRVSVWVYSSGLGGVFGSPYNPGLYQSPELAEAAAKGIYVLIVPSNSSVAFWLHENVTSFNDCSDNRGSVTLRFVPEPLATTPKTWGAVKALYR